VTRRAVSAGDDEFLWQLYVATREDEIAAWGWTPAQQDAFLRMQYHARRGSYAATYPDAEHSIVLDGETPIGAMIVARSAKEVRLVDIALLPENRGGGIGAHLLRDLMAEAAAAGLPLRLSVLRTNRAQRLYERLGFVATGGDAMYSEMEYVAIHS